MKILVVDDSKAMRMIVRRHLDQSGIAGLEISEAASGVEALASIEADEPDLVLSDWNMPEMNGFELLLAVRADPRYADLPLVMVTTETEMSQVMKALECGANEYVMKPFTADILRDKLDMLGLVPAA